MTATIDDTLMLTILREIRAEQKDTRTLLLQTVDYMRKMEQRLDARIVAVLDTIADRMAALEARD